MTTSVTLQFYRGDGPYEVTRRGSGTVTPSRVVDRAVAEETATGATFLGVVVEGQLRMPLRHSGWRLIAARNDMRHIILENAEGGQARFTQADDAPEVVFFMGHGYVIEQRLAPTEAVMLRRRWKGISPDADDKEGLDTMAHEREAPEPVENVVDVTVEQMALELARKSNVELTDENRDHFIERAVRRIRAMQRATNIPVPPPHSQEQQVHIVTRDPDSGELKVTHTYHDLHAPDGETVTHDLTSFEDTEQMGGLVAACAVSPHGMLTKLNTVASKICAGHTYDWNAVEKWATDRIGSESYDVQTICTVMRQEQDNRPEHGWKLSWPTVHLAPDGDSLTLCEKPVTLTKDWLGENEKRETLLWILPGRFKQCGPVPFSMMCEGCVKEHENMDESDPRLVPPEQRPEPGGRFVVEFITGVKVDVARYTCFHTGAQRMYLDGQALTQKEYRELLASDPPIVARITHGIAHETDENVCAWAILGEREGCTVLTLDTVATFPYDLKVQAARTRDYLRLYRNVYEEIMAHAGDPLSEDNLRRAFRKLISWLNAEMRGVSESAFVSRVKGLKPSDVPEAWAIKETGEVVGWTDSASANPREDIRRALTDSQRDKFGPSPTYWVGTPTECNCNEMLPLTLLCKFDPPDVPREPGDPLPGWKCPVHGNVILPLDEKGRPYDPDGRVASAEGSLIKASNCPNCHESGVVFDGVCVNCGEVGSQPKTLVGAKMYSTEEPEPFGSEEVWCPACDWVGMARHAFRVVGSRIQSNVCAECGSPALVYVSNNEPFNKGHNTNSKEAVNDTHDNKASGEGRDVGTPPPDVDGQ
jgi:hypothetical protein